MSRRPALILLLAAALGAAALDGAAGFGRVALGLGLPVPAAFDDPHERGVALYRAGRYGEAALAFREAGWPGAFDEGNAWALARRYAEALEAYDRALEWNPEDAAARANFDRVRAIYAGVELNPALRREDPSKAGGPVQEAPIGIGQGRAASTGEDTSNGGASEGAPLILSSGARVVRQTFDARFVMASERWLETIPDDPAVYLKALIARERARRDAAGETPGDAPGATQAGARP